MNAYVVGIGGGSCSGKTLLARHLTDTLGRDRVATVPIDEYQWSRDETPEAARATIDYDRPDAFDWRQVVDHLDDLAAGRAIDQPVYDFERHTVAPQTVRVAPAAIVIVEGILALHDPAVRARLDLALFVHADADVRLARRVLRDVRERGRTAEGVIAQYLATVRPGHLAYVEPTRAHADIVVPDGDDREEIVASVIARIRAARRG